MFDILKNKIFLGNSLFDYIIALMIFIIIVVGVTVIIKLAVYFLRKLEKVSINVFVINLLSALRRRLLPITYIVAVYSVLSYLKIPLVVTKFIDKVVVIFVAVFIILFINDLIKDFGENYRSVSKKNPMPSGIISIIKVLVWVIGILVVLSNLGYNISTLITGLGIGGVAIALASQAILGDLFNYFVILFDKPFKKGDLIQVDTLIGTVESIGIKSTKLRSVSGETLLVSNTDLTKSRVKNYKTAKKRRCLVTLGVVYDTPPEKLRRLPDIIENVVKSVPKTEFHRVHFSEFAPSSLNFELAYYVLTNVYVEYTQIVQEVNFRLIEEFAKIGVEFAYPTQTLYVQKTYDNCNNMEE